MSELTALLYFGIALPYVEMLQSGQEPPGNDSFPLF